MIEFIKNTLKDFPERHPYLPLILSIIALIKTIDKVGQEAFTVSLEKNIAEYIKQKGIKLSAISRKTGISYSALYSSLMSTNKNRELRATEFIKICQFLEKEPMDFIGKDIK